MIISFVKRLPGVAQTKGVSRVADEPRREMRISAGTKPGRVYGIGGRAGAAAVCRHGSGFEDVGARNELRAARQVPGARICASSDTQALKLQNGQAGMRHRIRGGNFPVRCAARLCNASMKTLPKQGFCSHYEPGRR